MEWWSRGSRRDWQEEVMKGWSYERNACGGEKVDERKGKRRDEGRRKG